MNTWHLVLLLDFNDAVHMVVSQLYPRYQVYD